MDVVVGGLHLAGHKMEGRGEVLLACWTWLAFVDGALLFPSLRMDRLFSPRIRENAETG